MSAISPEDKKLLAALFGTTTDPEPEAEAPSGDYSDFVHRLFDNAKND